MYTYKLADILFYVKSLQSQLVIVAGSYKSKKRPFDPFTCGPIVYKCWVQFWVLVGHGCLQVWVRVYDLSLASAPPLYYSPSGSQLVFVVHWRLITIHPHGGIPKCLTTLTLL